jgi:hypothetical protein
MNEHGAEIGYILHRNCRLLPGYPAAVPFPTYFLKMMVVCAIKFIGCF